MFSKFDSVSTYSQFLGLVSKNCVLNHYTVLILFCFCTFLVSLKVNDSDTFFLRVCIFDSQAQKKSKNQNEYSIEIRIEESMQGQV